MTTVIKYVIGRISALLQIALPALAITILTAPTHADEQTITVSMVIIPPYTLDTDQGFIPDLIDKVADIAGYKTKKVIHPWARSYSLGLVEKNILIPNIFWSEERKPHFKWVGEVLQVNNWLIKLNARKDIEISSLEDARKYMVGVHRSSINYEYFSKNGFQENKNLFVVTSETQLPLLLESKRIDLAGSEGAVFSQLATTAGFSAVNFEKTFLLEATSRPNNFAFSNKTDDEIVAKFKQALDQVKQDGTYLELLKKWRLTDSAAH